ncbi:MAG TPA: hypothetical protein VFV38_12230 [Ktedonobacteraceae bacterium]|nr:hypothetical protein [Ktedonobacteraceae bacterium]
MRELGSSGCLLIPEDPHDFSPASSATYAEVVSYLGLSGIVQEASGSPDKLRKLSSTSFLCYHTHSERER